MRLPAALVVLVDPSRHRQLVGDINLTYDVGATDPTARAPMAGRLDLAVAGGCDGVEHDNFRGLDHNAGKAWDREEQVDFAPWC